MTKHFFQGLKRGLLLGALGVVIAPSLADAHIPKEGELVFNIIRNGKDFGQHRLFFEKEADGTTFVDVEIDMEYSLGPINLFRYEHRNSELWQGDNIVALNSETYDDGDAYQVQAEWTQQGVDIIAQQNQYNAPAGIYSTNYWNPVILQADQLLNSQKGIIEEIKVTPKGTENITVQGRSVEAQKYQIEASVPIEIWYDIKTEQWVGLAFEVRGSQIRYERLTPIE